VIVDTGPLFAAAAARDTDHARCVELLSTARRPILVPALVVADVAYFLASRLGPPAEAAFAKAIADGELQVQSATAQDWERIHSLVVEYQDLPLGMVDASLVALAERLEVTTIATLDRKHFSVVRPRHTDHFALLP
jgi:predicted nucleic acid-binding protein